MGQFKANPWQLHDMMGNVWEWIQDCYVVNYDNTPTDGSAQESPDDKMCSLRVLRGGSWFHNPKKTVRSSARHWSPPAGTRNNRLGFRLARTL